MSLKESKFSIKEYSKNKSDRINKQNERPRIIMLGTGNPNPDPKRQGPSFVITYKQKIYLVDSGIGLLRRMNEAGLDEEKSSKSPLFISHLHSDHTLGYPDFILSPPFGPKRAFGPPGLKDMTQNILKAYEIDINIRIHGGEPGRPKETFEVEVKEIFEEGEFFDDGLMKVIAFKVPHGKFKYAYGFKFISDNSHIIVYSGDTAFSEEVINQSVNCDALIHEVYPQDYYEKFLDNDRQKYYKEYHTSGIELGKVAAAANIKKLILTHGLHISSLQEITEEIRQNGYKGDIFYPGDLDVIDV